MKCEELLGALNEYVDGETRSALCRGTPGTPGGLPCLPPGDRQHPSNDHALSGRRDGSFASRHARKAPSDYARAMD